MSGKSREKQHHSCNTPEYRCWNNMKQRCYNKNHPEYERYGKRGIRICKRWYRDFRNFIADMGNRPSKQHTIERKDNNIGYRRSNCVWAIKKTQARNRRTNRVITLHEKTLCIAEWAELYDLNPSDIHYRLSNGWPIELAITSPRGTQYVSHRDAQRHRTRHLTWEGITKTVPEWAEYIGISPSTIIHRIAMGYPMHDVLSATSKNKQGCRNRKNTRKMQAFGKIKTIPEWAELYNIRTDTLIYRIKSGMTPEEALTKPSRQKPKH